MQSSQIGLKVIHRLKEGKEDWKKKPRLAEIGRNDQNLFEIGFA
jgi:hypothetical protein